jgi:dipeptidyl aminopeptidase/acylaminoacyl peptidase
MLAKLPVSFASDPRWSPDGATIAFLGIEGGVTRHFLLDVERQALTSIDPGGLEVGAPAWTRDGGSLVYPVHEAAGWRLWRRELKGTGKPEPVSATGWRYVRIADGETYAIREHGPGVWRFDEAGRVTLVAPEVNSDPQDVDDSAHGWTVSAGRIYFIDQRKGPEHVRVLSISIQGGPATPVADGLDWAGGPFWDWYGGLAVDPRSGAIAYAKSGRRDNDIALYHLARK